ncbi:short-chain dehydrogenase reductase sdr [Diplodia corticola]|uniref:Short-chain dehydrogenase reductase sdr n=1 Tax=Diplodia corticola TaxID=236234 RepID=A0A1J9QPS9_9PEZI|nr:short-chain dehydrogenase reductase sdr [Diplodia corticola]OJD30465.1 short-chain dehydrogenase reductase sdr [Diplodia corticola]
MTSHPDFGHATKASEVADTFASQIKGRVVVVTGVSRGGLGGATALAFARQNPSLLILVSRTQSKLDDVISDIRAANPSLPAAAVTSVLVDLTSQATVRRAAADIKALTTRIDVLVNNAGFFLEQRTYSPEGIESQLAGNHIGPFLLTNLLRDELVAAAAADGKKEAGATRVVSLTSEGHRVQPFRFHDHNIEGKPVPAEEEMRPMPDAMPKALVEPRDGYVGFSAYGQSKTANVLFTVGLNERVLKGTGVVAYVVHPGTIFTEVGRSVESQDALDSFLGALNPKASTDEGAATTMVAALDPALKDVKSASSIYLDDCQLKDAEPYAVDVEIADRLWKFSEELVKQTF